LSKVRSLVGHLQKTFTIQRSGFTDKPPAIMACNSTSTTLVPGYWVKDASRDLYYRKAVWTDIAIFYLGNYFAHAAR
jgi:hypothetical protein